MSWVNCLLLNLSWLLIFPTGFAADGVLVSASVDRKQVGMGDVINLTISISADDTVQVEQPNLPPLSGFDVINVSSGVETRSSFVGGRFLTTQSRNFTFMLAVSQKGELVIPPINVIVDGKSHKTSPITIAATGARPGSPKAQAQQKDPFEEMDQMEDIFNQMLQRRTFPRGIPPSGQQNPPVNPEEAFFIQAETDKKKVYVGEQVTTAFYLYTRGQIRDIDTLKYPDLKGFWKEELEMATRLNFEQVVINGIPYQRALLVAYALFPIKPGVSTVDPYKAKCTVLSASSFGFGRPYQFTKASRAINIEVLDVPVATRPSNYSGAVGTFRVTAHFEPPTGAVNQPVTLRVRFEGHGNAKLIELPKLELLPSFELYDQKSQAKFLKDGTSFKEFEVLIIPHEPGVFNIPAVTASVFDPNTQKYSAISSQPLNISITGSAASPAGPTLPGAPSTQPGTSPTNELPGLVTDVQATETSPQLMYLLAGLFYLCAIFGVVIQARRSLRRKPKRESLNLSLKRRLKSMRAINEPGNWRRVGVELTNGVYYVLGQISEQGGAHRELDLMLESTPPSLRGELSVPLQTLLAKCEALSFAPESLVGDLTEKAKLEKLINEFEKVMNRAIELAEI